MLILRRKQMSDDLKALQINVRNANDYRKKNYGKWSADNTLENEWLDDGTEWSQRDNDEGWEARYQYESSLISDIIVGNDCKNILEIGSGPGKLSHYAQIKSKENGFKIEEYHLIDKLNAKKRFEKRKYEGKFFVKDLFNQFDTNGLNKNYDMIIANDFLEHIANPSDVVNKCWNLSHDDTLFFVSVPNWRMEHDFIYRGLFDFDNFKYFMWIHGFLPVMVKGFDLKTPPHPKTDYEKTLPDELLDSWNWYFVFRKITEEFSEEMTRKFNESKK